MLTLNQLKQLLPRNQHVSYWHHALEQLLPDYEINTPRRMAAFIAQCAHESGGFTTLKENLNYKPMSLRKLFPKYFDTDELAQQYCSKPNKQAAIANRIYANRMGNGDEASGDGYRFSGRGLIQLTGRATWQEFADSIETSLTDLDEYMQTFEGACQSACFFWESRKLNQYADASDIVTLTRKINGGTIGLEDRKKHYEHALHILGA
jgi:putative chitinase